MTWDNTAIRALEERAFNAWPALQSVQCNGWLFRFSEGLTRRANSVNALAPTGHFLETLDLAETLYGRLRRRRSSGCLPWPAMSQTAACTGRDIAMWMKPTS